jgi:hypothetical protein
MRTFTMRDLQQHPESKFLLLSSRDWEQSHRLCIIHLSPLEVQATTSDMVDKTEIPTTTTTTPKKKKKLTQAGDSAMVLVIRAH